MAAREAARNASSLDELRAILDRFEGCSLKGSASRLVFADGTPGSRLMLVGEAPGAEEDRQGLPFVGRSGQLLDRMLAAIGLERSKVYIANIVPWRPPGNRTPTPVETQICLPFIKRQIELCDPDVLVTIGQPSTGALLGLQGIMKNRGRWFPFDTGTREIRAMPMLHPAYLLRTPPPPPPAWRDWRAINLALGCAPRLGTAQVRFRRVSRIRKISPPTANTIGKPVFKAKPAIPSPKSAACCESGVTQVTPISLIGGHWPLMLTKIRASPAASTIASAG
jgi:DNA polymerase